MVKMAIQGTLLRDHAIHNGADDNASGTAALIELARILKQSKAKNNNYLFIAFSGEELGLFGSKYYVENPTIDLKKVDYMINMDMVGRLNDSTKVLTLGGIGTSPTWGKPSKQRAAKILFSSTTAAAPVPVIILLFTGKISLYYFISPACIPITTNHRMMPTRSTMTGNGRSSSM